MKCTTDEYYCILPNNRKIIFCRKCLQILVPSELTICCECDDCLKRGENNEP